MSRRVEYTVNLAAKPHIEKVEIHGSCTSTSGRGDQLASFTRFGKHVANFVVSAAQARKIRSGKGRLNISERAIERSRFCDRGRIRW